MTDHTPHDEEMLTTQYSNIAQKIHCEEKKLMWWVPLCFVYRWANCWQQVFSLFNYDSKKYCLSCWNWYTYEYNIQTRTYPNCGLLLHTHSKYLIYLYIYVIELFLLIYLWCNESTHQMSSSSFTVFRCHFRRHSLFVYHGIEELEILCSVKRR